MNEQIAEENSIQDNSVAHALVEEHHAEFKPPHTGSNLFDGGEIVSYTISIPFIMIPNPHFCFQAGSSHAVTVSSLVLIFNEIIY